MNTHLGDLIQLHALGALDDAERATVDAHVATCAACATELGEAEAVIAALDDAYVEPAELPASPFAAASKGAPTSNVGVLRPRARPAVYATGALAAALLFGLGFGTSTLFGAHARPHEGALATIASSHFSHVSLAPAAPGSPHAKVLYARDGAWFYAIVDAPAQNYRLRVRDAAHHVTEQTFAADGSVGTIFESHLAARPVNVDLLRAGDGVAIESAKIVYPIAR